MPPKKAPIKQTRTIPHNLEAEQSVLGSVLYDSETAADIVTMLAPEDFYSESHKFIFEAMQAVYRQNKPVDLVTLADALETGGTLSQAGGIPYITEITAAVPSAANFMHYAEIVRRDSVMRKLIRASGEIVETAHSNATAEEAVSFAEKQVFDIGTADERSGLLPLAPSVTEVIDKFQTIQTDKNALRGMPTGFSALDRLLNGGLHKSDLVLIAARPAVGKSTLAMNIVENAALYSGASCAVFSLEMPKVQIAQRLTCSVANVSMTAALNGKLGLTDWENIWKANKLIEGAKIFVDDSSLVTPPEILSKCRKLKAKSGLDLVMVDYIQLMSGSGRRGGSENRQQEISEISRSLKILAKELSVPVIALSQLSRAVESRKGNRPQLSDLRESGAIEQDADIVMFIHRPDRVNENADKLAKGDIREGETELIIAKHRNGATGTVPLMFNGDLVKFERTDSRADALAAAHGIKPAPKKPAPVEGYVPPEAPPQPAGEPLDDPPWND